MPPSAEDGGLLATLTRWVIPPWAEDLFCRRLPFRSVFSPDTWLAWSLLLLCALSLTHQCGVADRREALTSWGTEPRTHLGRLEARVEALETFQRALLASQTERPERQKWTRKRWGLR